MSTLRCSCGRRKDRRAKRCVECYHRRWTADEEATLRELIAAGKTYKFIGTHLKRSEVAVLWRARANGWHHDPDVAAANKAAGRAAFWADKKRVRQWKKKVKKALGTPLSRAIFAEEARRNERFTFKGHHHSPEVCRRISAAQKGRKTSPETRAKMSASAKARWAKQRDGGQAEYRSKLLADRTRLEAFGAWGEVQPIEANLAWCLQCERRVSAEQANSCLSPFCKAKAEAA